MKLQPSNEAAHQRPCAANGAQFGSWVKLLPALLLFAVVVGTFLPSLRNEFIEYDDSVYVYNNEHVKPGLSWDGIVWSFSDVSTGNWHPLTWFTHMLDAQLYGGAAWGHHLTSVLLHAINTTLLFVVLRRITGAVWASVAAAVLFGLHPMRVESVTWICERKDVLSGFFWIVSLWAYGRFVEEASKPTTKAKRFYLVSILLFFCGLMSKPVMVTFPCVLLLLDFWPLERWKTMRFGKLIVEKLPFFLLTALVCSLTYVAQKHTGMMNPLADLNLSERLQNTPVAYIRYLAKAFWPIDLCALYPHPGQWPIVLVLGSLVLVAAITVFVFLQRKQRPYLLTGWLWFLGTLVPMIGIVQVGAQSMADRYSYIPIIGICIALGMSVANLAKNSGLTPAWLCIGGVALVCAMLTRQQISYWHDNASVWRRAIAVTDRNFEAHYRLARALAIQGDLDAAIVEFNTVVELRPGFAEAHYSLGKALALKGQLDQALARFQRAVEIDPSNVVALNNVGNILLQRGRFNEAMGNFRRVLEIQADNGPAHSNLGYALVQLGQVDEAIAHLQKAVEFQPRNSSAHNNLGSVYLRRRDFTGAVTEFQIVLQLEPDSVEACNNLGSSYLALGKLEEAIQTFRAAIALQPGSAELRRNLGFALSQQGRLDEAIREFEEAVRLKPDYVDARTQLDNARAKKVAAETVPPANQQ